MSKPACLSDAVFWATAKLKLVAGDTSGLDARLLLCHATGLSREGLIAQGAAPLSEDVLATYESLIARRVTGESVARITGTKEFWSLLFELGPDTLEPRPDSECIVEALLDVVTYKDAPLSIIDLGTGTGCLLLSLLSELPHASGLGVDVATGALDVAARNADRLGLSARARFLTSDWLQAVDGQFDLVITNPPYITKNEMQRLDIGVRAFDPDCALCGGADGLDAYRVILRDLPLHLRDGAFVAMETSPQLLDELHALVAESPVNRDITIVNDLAGHRRGLRYRNSH